MPPNMMNAPTGSMPKVRGMSMEIVSAGPMPGKTPMAVPNVTPIKPYKRLRGASAAEKPSARLSPSCANAPMSAEKTRRQPDPE